MGLPSLMPLPGLWSLALLGALSVVAMSRAECATGVPYGVGSWPENLGNHRALVHVADKGDAVRVHIPWRRRDARPEDKGFTVVDETTGTPVPNVFAVNLNREFGDIVFQPATVPADYGIYYMPYTWTPGHSSNGAYLPAQHTADSAWLERSGLPPEQPARAKWQALPEAKVLVIEACSEFDRFDPMEVIATAEETQGLLASTADSPYLLFPEDREHAIRMSDDLPLRWIERGPGNEFKGKAQPNEFYVFQIGVYASRMDIRDVAIGFGGLKGGNGRSIPASAFRCFNLGGTDWLGRSMKTTFAVAKGKVRALWIGVQIPKNAAGLYQGKIAVHPAGAKPTDIKVSLDVKGAPLEDKGDGEPWRLSRLRWLDSTIGLDHDVVPPFTPLRVHGNTVACLGREVTFAATGLPESIKSNGREILAGPIAWVMQTDKGSTIWTAGRTKMLRTAPGAVERESRFKGGVFEVSCRSKTESDGCLQFTLRVRSRAAADLENVRLEIPIASDIATYLMGFSRKGGYRPPEWKWTWDINRCDNMVWVGDVDAGLQCKLMGSHDTWELFNLRASGVPDSWSNDGKGGAIVAEEDGRVMLRAYTGPRTMDAGEELEFQFRLLITPFKPIDPAHWRWRYGDLNSGATIAHLHHGTQENPYINYPFLRVEALRAFVEQVHRRGGAVNLYYTVRELSNHVAEMWALRSLGDEVFADGQGGGYAWLQEHLVSGYAPAWLQPLPGGDADAAIVTTGLSRWHNYYLEGLAWLMRGGLMDGLYLDGIGYDREIMRRVRKVMERVRPGAIINFHSGNNYVYRDHRVSPANQYMEHFPYVSSLWFGEMYDYDEPPDYWLVEISGIPFGLSGEMLNYENGGNQWRGVIYGMTGRFNPAKEHLWRLWDDLGISDAKMIGYWDRACPVKTSHKDIVATAYCKPDSILIALASWAPEPVRCRLEVDWRALGMNREAAMLTAPDVANFQGPAVFSPDQEIPVDPGKGWLLILRERQR